MAPAISRVTGVGTPGGPAFHGGRDPGRTGISRSELEIGLLIAQTVGLRVGRERLIDGGGIAIQIHSHRAWGLGDREVVPLIHIHDACRGHPATSGYGAATGPGLEGPGLDTIGDIEAGEWTRFRVSPLDQALAVGVGNARDAVGPEP
jgi:hypothetical protein